jgi:glycerophosphoryl diester phosphodiesterase
MRCENIDRMAPLFAGPPVLCGHRGMGVGTVLGHVENTLGSFLAAGALGLPWVEADVRVTADDVLVCGHDPVVEDGRFVIDLTAGETDPLGLLRFTDLLDGLPAELGLDVEVKSSLEDALRPRERTTGALIGRALAGREASRPLLVTSFDATALTIVREHADVPTGLLTWMRFPLRKAIPAAVHLGAAAVLPHFSSFGVGPAPARIERTAAEYVAVAHDAGLEVATWAPSPEEAEPLVAAGVDCLIVDHADERTWVPRRRLLQRRPRRS